MVWAQVISPSGGAVNLLYRLAPKDQSGKGPLETAGSGMGKLEIKWRSSLGDVGRLQTQQILAAAAASKELELQVAGPILAVCKDKCVAFAVGEASCASCQFTGHVTAGLCMLLRIKYAASIPRQCLVHRQVL